jgi:transcriptional regulator with XRE-family HTH domain
MTAADYKALRLSLNLKPKELADKLGVTVRTINLREAGETPIKPEAQLAIEQLHPKPPIRSEETTN